MKFLTLICSLLILVSVINGCSKSVQKTEQELRAEIRAELEAAAKAEKIKENSEEHIKKTTEVQEASSNVKDRTKNTNKDTIARKSLTDTQIEKIGDDFANCFGQQTLNINSEEAQSFGHFLVFWREKQHIIDNYIPSLESFLPIVNTEVTEGETIYGMGKIADGKYVELLGEAIFDVDIIPQDEYIWTPHDPEIIYTSLREVRQEDGKYIATFDIKDVVEQPYYTMELHLTLTSEGYPRVDYYTTEDIPVANPSTAGNLAEFVDEEVFTQDSRIFIKYSDYRAVIIPFYPEDGENIGKLSLTTVSVDPINNQYSVAIFGKLENVVVTKWVDFGNEGEWELGTLENTLLNIKGYGAGVDSFYEVTGQVLLSNGTYEDVRVTPDGPIPNKLITVKDEDYEGDI